MHGPISCISKSCSLFKTDTVDEIKMAHAAMNLALFHGPDPSP
jgi:hypothetical protein